MTTTTLAPAAPEAPVDAQLDEAPPEPRSDAHPSRGLWRLQMLFLALGLVIDFVAFSAALQVLDSQMVQWQAWLIAACGGALALFLMFEAGHLEARRRDTTKGRHRRGLIRGLIFVWLLAGLAATYIRVTTPPAGSGSDIFASAADSAAWDLGLFTVYADALPMALFMFVLYLGVGISAYIAGLQFEEHRQPSTWLTRRRERRALAAQRKGEAAGHERVEQAEAPEREHPEAETAGQERAEQAEAPGQERAKQAEAAEPEHLELVKTAELDRLELVKAAELDRLERVKTAELERKLDAELDRMEQLHSERHTVTVRLSQLENAQHELAANEKQLQALMGLEAALISLEEARAVRQQRADEHVSAQQNAASLRSQLEELPGQIDRETRGAQERGRYASEHARQVLSRGLGDPAKTVMGSDDSAADEDQPDDLRKSR